VEVRTGVADLGTGTRTALAMLVAEELGLEARQVTVRIADTDLPYAPGSGGSKTVVSLSPAVRNAAAQARGKLFEAVAPRLRCAPADLRCAGGRVLVRGQAGPGIPLASACAALGGDFVSQLSVRTADYGGPVRGAYGGVQFAEVSVDTQTGIVKVERVVAVHDCGRPINPLAIQSQINGGVLHGLSWALYEDRVLDPRNGQVLNPTLDSY
jgi:xanthine dehydrogenase YagR molybdenum-binding subunit